MKDKEIVDYTDDLNVDGMPEGLRTFVKSLKIPDDTQFTCSVYRLKKEIGERKLKRLFLKKFVNEYFEEDYGEEWLQKYYGGGSYQVIYTWPMVEKGKKKSGIQMEPMFVDGPEKITVVKENKPAPELAGIASDSPPIVGAVPFNFETILKHLPSVILAVEAIKKLLPKKDYSAIDRIYESQMKAATKFGDEIQKIKFDKLKKQYEQLDEAEEMTERPENFKWPAWLEPFAPYIEDYAGKIISGGPMAAFIKKTLVSNKTFLDCWNDEKKRSEAVEALTKFFGEEMAEQLEEIFDELLAD